MTRSRKTATGIAVLGAAALLALCTPLFAEVGTRGSLVTDDEEIGRAHV